MTIKKVISTAAAVLAIPAFAQQDGNAVQIYGRLNLTLENIHPSTDSLGNDIGNVTRMTNNRSVIGFRGNEDLGGGMGAIWQIESAVSLDTGAGSFAGRDTAVGLKTPVGTIFGGNWTTPYTSSTQGFDPFYPTTVGYMSIMGNGSAPSADNVNDTTSFDRRQRNSIHYWTPTWNGFTARVAHGLSEEKTATSKPSLTSLAGIYELGPVYLTLAHERHVDYQGPGLTDTGTKIGAAYSFGATRVAAVAEKIRFETTTGDLDRNAYYLSITHQMGPHGLRFGIAHAQDGKGPSTATLGPLRSGPDTGATHATIGYDYAFSKRTSLYAYLTRLDNKRNGLYDFAINELGVGPGTTLNGAALGIRHTF
jgi:predicted porin